MTDDSVATILSRIEAAQDLYYRLILVVGPCGSGKSATLRAVSAHAGAPVLNLNLELSRRLLDFTARQRLLEVPRMLDDVIGRDRPLVLLDNTELLFDPTLKQDPLASLQRASRNRTIVAASASASWPACRKRSSTASDSPTWLTVCAASRIASISF